MLQLEVGVCVAGGWGGWVGSGGLQHIRYVCHLSIKVCHYDISHTVMYQPGFTSGKNNLHFSWKHVCVTVCVCGGGGG